MMMAVAPSRPRPAVSRPADAAGAEGDLQGAGVVAAGAAAAVRTLPRMASHMPRKPMAPGEDGSRRGRRGCGSARLHEAEGDARRPSSIRSLVDLGRGDEHHDGERDHDHADGAELALDVGMAPSWMAPAISCISSVPCSWASTPRMRTKPSTRATTATAPAKISQPHSAARERECLVAALGGDDLVHRVRPVLVAGLVAGSVAQRKDTPHPARAPQISLGRARRCQGEA